MRLTPKRANAVIKEPIIRSELGQWRDGRNAKPDSRDISKMIMLKSEVLRFSQMLLKSISINHIEGEAF